MSVSGINSSELATYSVTNIQADSQLYREDSQALSENVQSATPSTTCGLTLLQPVSPSTNAELSALNTSQATQANTDLSFNSNGQAGNAAVGQAVVPGLDLDSASSNDIPQANPPSENTLLQTFQVAIQSEAQQAYASAQQDYLNDDNGTLSAIESLIA